jgi:hypothetical protein
MRLTLSGRPSLSSSSSGGDEWGYSVLRIDERQAPADGEKEGAWVPLCADMQWRLDGGAFATARPLDADSDSDSGVGPRCVGSLSGLLLDDQAYVLTLHVLPQASANADAPAAGAYSSITFVRRGVPPASTLGLTFGNGASPKEARYSMIVLALALGYLVMKKTRFSSARANAAQSADGASAGTRLRSDPAAAGSAAAGGSGGNLVRRTAAGAANGAAERELVMAQAAGSLLSG